MPSTTLDSSIFRDIFTTAEMRQVFSDENRTACYLEIEAALARVQGRLGIIPQEAAREIDCKCKIENIDFAKLKATTERIGYPILGVVQQIVAFCDKGLGEWCHWGATTQDITDTATIMQVRQALDLVEADMARVTAALTNLARRYRDTPMAGRSSSSTMPQKRNPIASLYIHSTAALVRQNTAALLEAAVADHERSTGPWEIEWIALPEIFLLSAGTLRQTRDVVEGLQVDAARMRANLDLTGGAIVSEHVMMGLGPHLGRQRAHDLVYDICREAATSGKPLVDLLAAGKETCQHIGRNELQQMFRPGNYR